MIIENKLCGYIMGTIVSVLLKIQIFVLFIMKLSDFLMIALLYHRMKKKISRIRFLQNLRMRIDVNCK